MGIEVSVDVILSAVYAEWLRGGSGLLGGSVLHSLGAVQLDQQCTTGYMLAASGLHSLGRLGVP